MHHCSWFRPGRFCLVLALVVAAPVLAQDAVPDERRGVVTAARGPTPIEGVVRSGVVIDRGGNDIVFLGAGDDLFPWNSGDGSDLVDGGAGFDTLAFNGSAAPGTIRLSTRGPGHPRGSGHVDNGK